MKPAKPGASKRPAGPAAPSKLPAGPAAPPSPRPPAVRRSPLIWIAVPLLALALFVQTGRMRDRLLASRMLRQVELLSLAAVAQGQMPAGLVPGNLALLRQAEARDRTEVGISVARGTQYLLLRNGHEAAAAYREALKLEPRPEIHLNLGRAFLLSGDRDAAREEFRLALKLDPRLTPMIPADLR